MAFAKEIIRNEVMLRFGEVGNQRGKLIGALQRSLEQILEDGVIISSKPLEPEQLALLLSEDGNLLGDILEDITAQTIIDNQVMAASLAAQQATSSLISEQLAAAQAEIDRLTNLLTESAFTEL